MTEPRKVWVRFETDVWARVGTDGSVERVVVNYDIREPFDGIEPMEGNEFKQNGEYATLSDEELEQVGLAEEHIMSDGYPSERWEIGPLGDAPGASSKSLYQEREQIWEGILQRGCGHGCHCLTMLREDLMRRGVDGMLRERQ